MRCWFLPLVLALQMVELDVNAPNPISLELHILTTSDPPTYSQGYGYALDTSIQVAEALNVVYQRVVVRSVEVCPGTIPINCQTIYNKTSVIYAYTERRRLTTKLQRRILQGKQLIAVTILFPSHTTAPTSSKLAMDFQLKLRNPLSSIWTSVSALEFGDVTFIMAEVHDYDTGEETVTVIENKETVWDALAGLSPVVTLLLLIIFILCWIFSAVLMCWCCNRRDSGVLADKVRSVYAPSYASSYFHGDPNPWSRVDDMSYWSDNDLPDYATTFDAMSEATTFETIGGSEGTMSVASRLWDDEKTNKKARAMDDMDLEIMKRKGSRRRWKREHTDRSFGPILVEHNKATPNTAPKTLNPNAPQWPRSRSYTPNRTFSFYRGAPNRAAPWAFQSHRNVPPSWGRFSRPGTQAPVPLQRPPVRNQNVLPRHRSMPVKAFASSPWQNNVPKRPASKNKFPQRAFTTPLARIVEEHYAKSDTTDGVSERSDEETPEDQPSVKRAPEQSVPGSAENNV